MPLPKTILVRIGYIGNTQGVKAKPTPSAKNSNGVHQLSLSSEASVDTVDEGVLELLDLLTISLPR